MYQRKLILYIATSLDGYIAGEEHQMDWLFSTPGDGDNGFSDFYLSPYSSATNQNNISKSPPLTPSEESYFISNKWRNQRFKHLLDFGCGLGRHSILCQTCLFSCPYTEKIDDGR